MITTVTLNPSVDKIFKASSFALDELNRVEIITRIAGGKGINISFLLKALGIETTAMGFIGGINGRFVEGELQKIGITTNLVHIDSETRTNYLIIDSARRFQTQIDEPGPTVSLEEIETFKDNYKRILTSTKLVVIAGSLPEGMRPDFYGEIISEAQKRNIPVVFNAGEANLLAGLEAKPYLVRPDIRSINKLFGLPMDTVANRIKAAKRILDKGVEIVVIGFDHINLTIATKDKIIEAKAPETEIVNKINLAIEKIKQIVTKKQSKLDFINRLGSTDAGLGGIIYILTQSGDLKEMAKWGVAASIAASLRLKARVKDRQEVEEFLNMIEIKEVG